MHLLSPVGTFASTTSAAHQDRIKRRKMRRRTTAGGRTSAPFEPLEPRMLLSAEAAAPWLAAAGNTALVAALEAGDEAPGTGSISGVKFEDLNGDGVRDVADPALAGWTIFLDDDGDGLFDEGETAVQTDDDGAYTFEALGPGTYMVTDVVAAGWGRSMPAEPDVSLAVTLTTGEVVDGVDFGNFRHATISGLKWNDLNGNAERDADAGTGEGGPIDADDIELTGIGPVVLARNDDLSTGLVGFDFTFEFYGNNYDSFYINNNGNITFTQSLYDYVPDGFPQPLPIVAPFWADVDTRATSSAEVHLARGTSPRGNPFIQVDWPGVGYFANHVDKLNDFTLYIEDDAAGDIVAFFYDTMQWTTGDIDGNGGFGGGGAQIGFDSGDGVNFISIGRPSTANGAAALSNTAQVFRIDPSGVPTQEPEAGIGGVTIYLDLNDNGALDEDEPSTVTLGDDPETDADEAGTYAFATAQPGTYTVREVVPLGFAQTFPDPLGDTGGVYVVTVSSGDTVEDIDFGNVDLGSITGHKFEDSDGDGVRDDDEPGLAGWTIFIDANDNDLLDPGELSTLTDDEGAYAFNDLGEGSFRVIEEPQAGWVATLPAEGAYDVELGLSVDVPALDFGNYRPAEITGSKFEDQDADGTRDDDDAGLAAWTIFLDTNGDGILDEGEAATDTGIDGTYAFVDLTPGDYVVAEVPVEGWQQSLPDGGAHAVALRSGDSVQLDFGNFQAVTLSGTKWEDLSGDGVRDGGEPPLAQWTIFVDTNGNGTLDDGEPATETDVDGAYALTLDPGEHTIAEILPDHWYQSFPLTGIHDVDATGTHVVALTSGQDAADLDFGNFRLGTITGTARGTIDPDADGPRDPDDVGVPGFVVFLDLNEDGELDGDEPFQVTDAEGGYLFEDLLPGTYVVTQQPRDLWLPGDPPGDAPQVVDLAIGAEVTDADFLSLPDGPDLVGTVALPGVRGTLTPGTRLTATVVVTNLGTEPIDTTVLINLHASTDQALDDADPIVATVPNVRLRLKPGQSRTLRVRFVLGQDLSPGNHFLLADVDAANVAAETIDQNNLAATDDAAPYAWLFGEVPGRGNVRLSVVDDAGSPVTLALTGGSAQVVGGASFDELIITGSTRASRLLLATRGRGVYATLHDVSVHGSLGTMSAGSVNLGGGTVHVEGTLGSAQFHDVTGPTTVMIDRWDGRSPARLGFAAVADLSVDSAAPLGLFSADSVGDGDGLPDTITTPWIDRLDIDHDFMSDLVLTSTASRHSIGRAGVGGWFEHSTVWAPNDLGRLVFGGIRNASIYNGVRRDFIDPEAIPASLLPDSADDFLTNQASIAEFTLRGIRGEPFTMIESNVATWDLGRVRLGRVQPIGTTAFGLVAHGIDTYFRQRETRFSPTNRDLTGPAVIDATGQFMARLIASGRV